MEKVALCQCDNYDINKVEQAFQQGMALLAKDVNLPGKGETVDVYKRQV